MIVSVEEGTPGVAFKYQYEVLDDGFLHLFNEQFALEARAWLVAESKAILDRYVPVIESETWTKYVATDRVHVEPVRYLTTGFRIPKKPKRGEKR